MALINCPECENRVSSQASNCPNCGHPMTSAQPIYTQPIQQQKPVLKKESALGIWALVLSILGCTSIIGLILGIIDLCRKDSSKKHTTAKIAIGISCFWILCGILLGNPNSKTDESVKVSQIQKIESETSKPAVHEEKTEFGIGEVVELNGIETELLSIKENTGSQYNKPTEGNVYVLLEFEISNNSDKDISVSSVMSFEAYCDDYSISQSITGLLEKDDKKQLDGSIAAGKKMNGIIAYEVPVRWQEIEISFTPDFWRSKDIKFIITK